MSFDEKLAKLVVNYSVSVQPKESVFIWGNEKVPDLIQTIYIEVLKQQAFPTALVGVTGLDELLYKFGSDEQLKYFSPIDQVIAEKIDKLIIIQSPQNTKGLNHVDPERMRIKNSTTKNLEFYKILNKRESEGKFSACAFPYPSIGLARDAGMGLFAYRDFYREAMHLDEEDPVKYWKTVEKEQQRIVEYLNTTEKFHVLGEDTDLTFTTKGRTWVLDSGRRNLPGSEIYTSPEEDSINGFIRFTYPGIRMGYEIENIYLKFTDGKVTKATATKGQDLLDAVLKIEGADGIGEFAIGTNYNIKKFTKCMGFDEKMGGTIHMALGNGFPETGSKAISTIHWDILKDMTSSQSKIFADDKLIYEAGKWKI
ncbi:MAG: aminopeptidase [Candidatus Heimdallarchaeaceae archaeon]|jgi:aminopeptidase